MRIFAAALAACALAVSTAAGEEAPEGKIEMAEGLETRVELTTEVKAPTVLAICRAMLPEKPVALKGQLIMRSRKGIVSKEYGYSLEMRRTGAAAALAVRISEAEGGKEIASASIVRAPGAAPVLKLVKADGTEEAAEGLVSPVMGTDVTWLDLTLDYLWWPHAEYEEEREGESIHGQECLVILAKPGAKIPGVSAVRLWVEKKTGCMLQAEQVGEDGKPARRLWGTRIKKFEGRWFASVLEVEKTGARRRTKITVDDLKILED